MILARIRAWWRTIAHPHAGLLDRLQHLGPEGEPIILHPHH